MIHVDLGNLSPCLRKVIGRIKCIQLSQTTVRNMFLLLGIVGVISNLNSKI